jgi:hypothetical protein
VLIIEAGGPHFRKHNQLNTLVPQPKDVPLCRGQVPFYITYANIELYNTCSDFHQRLSPG